MLRQHVSENIHVLFIWLTNTFEIVQFNSFPENKSDKGDYSFLYKYLSGSGAHNFRDAVTVGFLGAYGDIQVSCSGTLGLAWLGFIIKKKLERLDHLRCHITVNVALLIGSTGLLN